MQNTLNMAELLVIATLTYYHPIITQRIMHHPISLFVSTLLTLKYFEPTLTVLCHFQLKYAKLIFIMFNSFRYEILLRLDFDHRYLAEIFLEFTDFHPKSILFELYILFLVLVHFNDPLDPFFHEQSLIVGQ